MTNVVKSALDSYASQSCMPLRLSEHRTGRHFTYQNTERDSPFYGEQWLFNSAQLGDRGNLASKTISKFT